MSAILSLDDLLGESLLQAKARKLPRNHATAKNIGTPMPKVSAEVAETAVMLRQWEHKREWVHTANVIAFTRQRCQCCGEEATTFEGFFVEYTNTRIRSGTKLDRVQVFDLDKPKKVRYHDALVPICHECADVQQDWPLEGD